MDNNDYKSKYAFKPYSPIFPELFNKEKKRLLEYLKGFDCTIEHFGSTAIKDVGGKGIIDIYIITEKEDLLKVSKILQKAGYEFRPAGGDEVRLFHVTTLPDKSEGNRIYHVHVSFYGSTNWTEDLLFRDWLNDHPEDAKTYSEIKEKAAREALKENDRSKAKKIYQEIKDPVITEIIQKMHINSASLKMAEVMLNKEVTVTIDRRLGEKHPKWDWNYEVNYGYIKGTLAPDGKELDAYVLLVDKPVDSFTGIVTAIVHRLENDDDKLIVIPTGMTITDKDIENSVAFQEDWFKHKIIRNINK